MSLDVFPSSDQYSLLLELFMCFKYTVQFASSPRWIQAVASSLQNLQKKAFVYYVFPPKTLWYSENWLGSVAAVLDNATRTV